MGFVRSHPTSVDSWGAYVPFLKILPRTDMCRPAFNRTRIEFLSQRLPQTGGIRGPERSDPIKTPQNYNGKKFRFVETATERSHPI